MGLLNDLTAPVEKLGKAAKDYGEAKLDTVKLQAAKGVSQGVAALTCFLVLLIIGSALMLVLSFGLIMLLGEAIGSYSNAAFIVAGGLLLLFLLLLLTRKWLFRNSFISTFVNAFTATDSEEEGKAVTIRTREQLDAAIMKSQAQEYKQEARLIKYMSKAQLLNSPLRLFSFLFNRLFNW